MAGNRSVIENDLDDDTYIGLELPLDMSREGIFRRSKTALQQTKSNIKNLLLTQKGERLGNPTFGCNLRSVLFEQENTDIESKIEEEIRGAMGEFLPFVNIEKIETAFSPTNKNLVRVNLKFGLNYIIIPENIDTILPLLDYIIDVNSKVDNGRGIDFLTLREDIGSVTEITDDVDKIVEGRKYHLDGFLSEEQRTELIDIFKEFNDRKDKECPELHVDFGYAMVALGEGVLGKPLARVNGTQMRKSGFPQLSVAIDSAGDVFLYREAGFLDRPGNDKFIAGRISDDETLESVLKGFVDDKETADLVIDDSRFMDSYDHLITLLVNQAEEDKNFRIPFEKGPVKVRSSNINELNVQLSNNWYRDEKN